MLTQTEMQAPVSAMRHTLFALAAGLVLLLAMPGLAQAVTLSTALIAVAGGIAVGVSAMAARSARGDRRRSDGN